MGRRRLRAAVTAQVDSGVASLIPDPDRRAGWLLLIDETQQSHVDLDDPGTLAFEYMRRIGHVVDLLPAGPLRAVHLGGGAMTLARYASATRPRTTNLVVDNDARLVDMVRTHLPWPRTFQIRVRCGDAREAMARLDAGGADLLILDVFAGARTPPELTSVQAFALAERALSPSGTLVANIADMGALTFARSYVAGVRAIFGRVLICAEPAVMRGRRFGNLIVVAQSPQAEPLDLAALVRRCACDPSPGRVTHGSALDSFVGDHGPFGDDDATGSLAPPPGFLG